jgi:hypothetical protein
MWHNPNRIQAAQGPVVTFHRCADGWLEAVRGVACSPGDATEPIGQARSHREVILIAPNSTSASPPSPADTAI